ncbi:MAG: hypothetical protein IKS32_03570 [Solobacterium sp.]|nr:hypothetical protein [Solobacterium sp.]
MTSGIPKETSRGDSIEWKSDKNYLDNGGDFFISSQAPANNIGPVSEADAPYEKGASWTLPDELAVSSNAVQVTDSYVINPDQIDGIKQAIIDHGGVAASMFAASGYYSKKYNSYLCDVKSMNHGVMLVGWDDSFPKDHFAKFTARDNGAWLVRNSWGGQGYEYSGYFWMSYYDYGLNYAYVFAFGADTQKYDDVYAYNLNPTAEDYIKVSGRQTVVKQDFTVDAGEFIKAVSVATGNTDMTVSVTVTDGKKTASGIISQKYFGIYTIPLDIEIETTERTNVSVTVTYQVSKGNSVLVMFEDVVSRAYNDALFTSSFSGPGFTVNGKKYSRDAEIKLYTGKERTPAPKDSVAMARLYNPNSGEHFYTGFEQEKNNLISAGWRYEGIGFYAPKESNTPIYRLYNPNAGDHHYTFSTEERDNLLKVGWKDEGIGWYSDDAHKVKMYRLYNPNAKGAGAHHYTASYAERQNLIRIGWRDEDIGFYAMK